jgi:D-proline reductase (dithiol) PrdB
MQMQADSSWIPSFRRGYAAWWPDARPLIEAHRFAAAFKSYPWPNFTASPWTPVRKPLSASRIAVVTTGGLYLRGWDPPFDTDALDGDTSYRRLPADAPAASLGIAHPHFPHEVAEADLNTIYPLARLRALAQAGMIGGLAPSHYSLMGYAPRAADLAEETAPAIAAQMRDEGVDAALLVPV